MSERAYNEICLNKNIIITFSDGQQRDKMVLHIFFGEVERKETLSRADDAKSIKIYEDNQRSVT